MRRRPDNFEHPIQVTAYIEVSSINFNHLLNSMREKIVSPRTSQAAWIAVDQFGTLAVSRLLFFPLLVTYVGADAFGAYLVGLGLVNSVATTPVNGLVGYTLREYAKENEGGQRRIVRTCFALSLLIMLPVVAAVIVFREFLAEYCEAPVIAQLLIPLAIFMFLQNVVEAVAAQFMVKRDFRRLAFFHIFPQAFLFVSLLFVSDGNVLPVAWVQLLGMAIIAGVLFSQTRHILNEKPLWTPEYAKPASQAVFAMGISAFIVASAGQLDRIVIGIWWELSDVSNFFVAAGTTQLFTAVPTLISNLSQGMLGKVKDKGRFSTAFYWKYLLGNLVVAVALFLLGAVLGDFILGILYPDLRDAALPFWNLALAARVIFGLAITLRPFVVKFISLKRLPVIATSIAASRLIALFLLVPTRGARGAVEALVLAAVMTCLSWGVPFFYLFLRPNRILADVQTEAKEVDPHQVD